jgi:hypothetical protein
MKSIEIVLTVAKLIPAIVDKNFRLSSLKKLGYESLDGKYLTAALLLALLISMLSLPIIMLFGELNVLLPIFIFLFFFCFFLLLPELELRKKEMEIESELPLALRTMGMLLELKVPFLQVLESISSEQNTLGQEMQKVVYEIKNGAALQAAFSRMSAAYSSPILKRAMVQIVTAYEVGTSGKELSKIGEEFLLVQQHKLREYASKSALFGLLFVVVSAVLPAFFLIYAVLGAYVFDSKIDDYLVVVTMLLVFPLLGTVILIIGKSTMPVISFGRKELNHQKILIALFIILMASFFILPEELRIFGVGFGYLATAYVTYKAIINEKRAEEIEHYLPDALFSAAALPKSVTMERIFETMGKAEYGALAEECEKTRKQLASGVSVPLALHDLELRNDSENLKRAATMLDYAYQTNRMDNLNKLADDILRFTELKREGAALASMQKYTMFFGALLIPLILGITMNLLEDMLHFFTNDLSSLKIVSQIIQPYLLVYAAMSATYASVIEGKRSNIVIYFFILSLVSMLVMIFYQMIAAN